MDICTIHTKKHFNFIIKTVLLPSLPGSLINILLRPIKKSGKEFCLLDMSLVMSKLSPKRVKHCISISFTHISINEKM